MSFAKAGVSGICLAARSDLASLEQEVIAAAKAVGKKAPLVKTIKLDVLSPESIEHAAAVTKEDFGHLDVLVNNAGFMPDTSKRTIEADPDEWWRTFEVNTHGTYLLTRALLPLILNGTDKHIIMLTSIGAWMHTPGMSAYQISKLAILRLTEHLDAEYSKEGLIAFAVHPGAVMTELASKMPEHIRAKLTDKPELPGDTIVYLSAEKREWLKGRYISCTWDMDELMSREEEIVNEGKLMIKLSV